MNEQKLEVIKKDFQDLIVHDCNMAVRRCRKAFLSNKLTIEVYEGCEESITFCITSIENNVRCGLFSWSEVDALKAYVRICLNAINEMYDRVEREEVEGYIL